TTAVLDGLRGAADASNAYGKDDIVSLGELKEYVATRVEHERLNYRWSKPITPQLRDMTVNTGAFFFAVPTGKFGIRRGVQMRQNVAGTAVGKSDDIVLARVGDEEITRGHVRAVWQDLPAEYKNLPEDVLFSGLVEQIADQMMLAKLIDQRKMPEELRARLRAQRLSILASAASQNVVAADITEAAIEAAYQERYANAPRAIEYNAAHILLTSETRADEVLARLRAGEDFGEVAKQVSTGPSGPNGGELGWFAQDMMVPEFGSFVAELEVGATDGPVQTQFGWHLVKLNDRRLVQPPPLVDVRDDLVQDLTQGAIDNALTRLKLDVTLERLVDAPPEGLFAQ
ncbi:MAG: peptidylprolyl isomerase, partial [Pseudomonadota bacterium]